MTMSETQGPESATTQGAQGQTPFVAIGGAEMIARLVDAFYPRVQRDPMLAPIFPEDIAPVRDKQYMFLTQFLGGPPLYSQRFGHPMLRARHLPHAITPARAEAWLRCMREAMDECGLSGPVREGVYERLKMTAYHMVNRPDDESPSS
ncbi:MAG: globin [Firmicutes bacterium]|nr:globin [Bacillota bacterium]